MLIIVTRPDGPDVRSVFLRVNLQEATNLDEIQSGPQMHSQTSLASPSSYLKVLTCSQKATIIPVPAP